MNNKKDIYKLLKNISAGDYNKAKGDISTIIEGKISKKIKTISQSKKSK
jgi:hypothetical protein